MSVMSRFKRIQLCKSDARKTQESKTEIGKVETKEGDEIEMHNTKCYNFDRKHSEVESNTRYGCERSTAEGKARDANFQGPTTLHCLTCFLNESKCFSKVARVLESPNAKDGLRKIFHVHRTPRN